MVSRNFIEQEHQGMDFTSYHHESPRHQPSDDFAHLCTLGRSIIEGDAKWTKDVLNRYEDRLRHLKIYDIVYASLFTYDHNSDIVKAFCEVWWPLTNTLLTSAGEMSISLWDLHELVGLPMAGCLYDEVVPSALELTGIDEKRERLFLVPVSICFMLITCFKSADDIQCSHVSIDKWVKIWSKKTTKYHPPPPRKEKKMVRSKSTHNSLGDIAIHEMWSTVEKALFAKVCIETSLKEEVYLAAYLACWLCVFVLLGKGVNSIRPSTFKMASVMANGRRVNLAIPILMGRSSLSMMVMPKSSIIVTLLQFRVILLFVKAKNSSLSHNPHRFGSQFRYYQDIPGTLRYDTRVASLEEGLCYWCLCVLSKSSSKAWFPCLPANAKKLCSEAYKAWWAKVHGTFFYDNITCLIRPKSIKITLKRKKDENKQVDGDENDPPYALIPPVVIECDSQAAVAKATNFVAELEDEVQSIDVGEESETSHSSTMTPPLGMGLRRKQSPPPVAVSVFKGESFLLNYQKEFLQRLWSGLLVKISNTPVDFFSSIEDDVYLILEFMKSFQKFDIFEGGRIVEHIFLPKFVLMTK
ncbi:UNVERIFIED_CONTAM: hypothetical protein Sangu_0381000 [Sesamum angustifolium]|uniref:Aminotransferase-like plant mobile domain-containing protein n=1 Tax=Sesamum angustifolium TaxID=2727405 RepID=A0AAW2QSF4_9LAMI